MLKLKLLSMLTGLLIGVVIFSLDRNIEKAVIEHDFEIFLPTIFFFLFLIGVSSVFLIMEKKYIEEIINEAKYRKPTIILAGVINGFLIRMVSYYFGCFQIPMIIVYLSIFLLPILIFQIYVIFYYEDL